MHLFYRSVLLLLICVMPFGSGARAAGEGQSVRLLDLESVVGAGWEQEQPSSTMRLLQYRVPGAAGADPAAFLVYYFGPGQGRIERGEHRAVAIAVRDGGRRAGRAAGHDSKAGELPVTLVELRGSYARSWAWTARRCPAGPDPAGGHRGDAEGQPVRPAARPTATVAPARAAFEPSSPA